MAGWLHRADEVLGRYPHVIAGLEAGGTLAAVIVSLVLALLASRSNRTKLKANASYVELFGVGGDPNDLPEYIAISVTNTGTMALRIPYSFCYMRIPLRRSIALILPLDHTQQDRHIPFRHYPFEVRPRMSETCYVTTRAVFRINVEKLWRKEPGWRRPLFRFLRVKITTEDGATFTVSLSKDLRREIVAAKNPKDSAAEETAKAGEKSRRRLR